MYYVAVNRTKQMIKQRNIPKKCHIRKNALVFLVFKYRFSLVNDEKTDFFSL
jgi:hypothetical protein